MAGWVSSCQWSQLDDSGLAYRRLLPQTAKLLSGKPAPALDLRCASSLPFTRLSQVVEREVPALYRPASGMETGATPSARRLKATAAATHVIIESSTTALVLPARVGEDSQWFAPHSVVTQLRSKQKGGRRATAGHPTLEHLTQLDPGTAATLTSEYVLST
jgi:hypothetical protein